MSPIRLSIIVPTIGRPTLDATLAALRPDLAEADEVLVVGDGDQPTAKAAVEWTGDARIRYFGTYRRTSCYGNAQRQFGMAEATGTHLVFIDDDDTPLVGYAAIWRVLLARDPEALILARMIDRHGLLLWSQPELVCGNVSTQMIGVPNDPERLGTWGARYEGDFDFIRSTWREGGWPLAWRTQVVVDCRPHAPELVA